MKSLPEGLQAYKRTPEFTRNSVPAGLLRAHTTKPGTWARIVVLEGRLAYRILEPREESVVLTPRCEGVVEPQVPHEVEPLGEVRFYVQFYR